MNTVRNTNGSEGKPQSAAATSMSLLARVQVDEPQAWERLVNLYAPLVFHWCRSSGLHDHQIADIFQEVFQAVVKHVGKFRKEREGDTFRGWLRRITQNKLRDHFRKVKGEAQAEGGSSFQERLGQLPQPPIPEVISETQDPAERSLFNRALELIKKDFEERTWKAFWETAVEGRASKDVAADLSMSAGAVRVAKFRVLHRLREELGDFME